MVDYGTRVKENIEEILIKILSQPFILTYIMEQITCVVIFRGSRELFQKKQLSFHLTSSNMADKCFMK